MRCWLLNGLSVAAPFALDAYRPSQGPADLTIEVGGGRRVPGAAPPGELLQSYSLPGRPPLYSTARQPDGRHVLRAHSYVDFEISQDMAHVLVRADDRCPAEMLPILSSGLLVSTWLALRGEFVLHASAVEAAGSAMALSAPSGMGKSTIAAIACAAGARLVTDDVLRLALGDGLPRCYLGAMENRLRRSAGDIDPTYAGTPTATSVDGRVLLRPTPSTRELSTLAAVVVPLPDRNAASLQLTRLSASSALIEMTRCLRAQGWRAPALRMAAFQAAARLAREVPLYRARLPWGPPFDSGAVTALMSEVGLVAPGAGLPAGARPGGPT